MVSAGELPCAELGLVLPFTNSTECQGVETLHNRGSPQRQVTRSLGRGDATAGDTIAPMHKTGGCASSPYRKEEETKRCRPESGWNVPGCEVMLGPHVLDYLVDRFVLCDVKTRNDMLIFVPIVNHDRIAVISLMLEVATDEVFLLFGTIAQCCHYCSPYGSLARRMHSWRTQ